MEKRTADTVEQHGVGTGFFSLPTDGLAERWRSGTMIVVFTVILVPYLLAYGVRDYLAGQEIASFVNFAGAGILLLNWVLYKIHGNPAWARPAVSLSTAFVLVYALFDGGVAGTAIYWLFVYPPATFLFQGVRRGLVYNGLFLTAVALYTEGKIPFVPNDFYAPEEIRQMWIVMSAVILLGIVTEFTWEKLRRNMVAQREQLRTLLETLPVGVIVIDGSSEKVIAENAWLVRIVGNAYMEPYDYRKMISVMRMTKEDGTPLSVEGLPVAAVLNGSPSEVTSDIFLTDATGEKLVVRMAAAPARNEKGNMMAVVCVITDMSKEYEINKMKSEFISLASHQFKTPLAGIRWTVDMLLEEPEGLSEEKRSQLAGLQETTARLSDLVYDLLNVSRIETGKKFNLDMKPTNIVPVIKDAASSVAKHAERRMVAVDLSALPESHEFIIDAGKIREVFINLLSNAVKYSPEWGKVSVGILDEPKGPCPVLFVRDEGIGIPHDQQSQVFERFFRANNVPKEMEGTGLGLFIVHAIVEKHGGSIWFEPNADKGTTFFVALPCAEGADDEKGE